MPRATITSSAFATAPSCSCIVWNIIPIGAVRVPSRASLTGFTDAARFQRQRAVMLVDGAAHVVSRTSPKGRLVEAMTAPDALRSTYRSVIGR